MVLPTHTGLFSRALSKITAGFGFFFGEPLKVEIKVIERNHNLPTKKMLKKEKKDKKKRFLVGFDGHHPITWLLPTCSLFMRIIGPPPITFDFKIRFIENLISLSYFI